MRLTLNWSVRSYNLSTANNTERLYKNPECTSLGPFADDPFVVLGLVVPLPPCYRERCITLVMVGLKMSLDTTANPWCPLCHSSVRNRLTTLCQHLSPMW